MVVVGIFILGMILLAVPILVGTLFFQADRGGKNLIFAWVSGQMLLWAGFQVIAVPMVLRKKSFTQVVWFFLGYMALLVILAAVSCLWRKRTGKAASLHLVKNVSRRERTGTYLLWAVFAALLVFQIVQSFRLAYADGDDAFYVAVASIAEESNTMYQKMAYSGGFTELEARYGLAPFPLWIAFLARMSGIRTVSVAQVAVPPVMIAMTYGIYYLLGSRLFAKNRERIPLFLIFTELLVLFGDYSFYTAENFMIARSRQGKAALGNILIPMLILLLFLLLEKLQENQKIAGSYWLLLLCTLTAACLCSTLGALLTCMLIGVTGICAAVCYRKWRFLIPLGLCCAPCGVVAVLYVML